MKRIVSALAVAALALSACGGGGGGDQAKAADKLIASGKEAGFELDEACVKDLAGKLSDADAKLIVEAGADDDPTLSAEGEALGNQAIGCVSKDSFVDQILAELPDDGSVDKDCVKDKLKDLDPADLASGEVPDEMSTAMVECIKLDS